MWYNQAHFLKLVTTSGTHHVYPSPPPPPPPPPTHKHIPRPVPWHMLRHEMLMLKLTQTLTPTLILTLPWTKNPIISESNSVLGEISMPEEHMLCHPRPTHTTIMHRSICCVTPDPPIQPLCAGAYVVSPQTHPYNHYAPEHMLCHPRPTHTTIMRRSICCVTPDPPIQPLCAGAYYVVSPQTHPYNHYATNTSIQFTNIWHLLLR